MAPSFQIEKSLYDTVTKRVAGVDEVGRGCLAGPVVAAAVQFDPLKTVIEGVNDSKKLSPRKRVELLDLILSTCLDWGLGIASVAEINQLGIAPATSLAMKRALSELGKVDHILIDGLDSKHYRLFSPLPYLTVVKGDQKSFSIAAASIVAKTFRDALMAHAHRFEDRYDWCHNVGYGTLKHREAIKKFGVTEFHRQLFVRSLI